MQSTHGTNTVVLSIAFGRSGSTLFAAAGDSHPQDPQSELRQIRTSLL